MTVVYNSGPINLETGNTANFTLQFLSSSGALTVPSTTNMTITYTNTSNASASETITLSESNSFFTGTWSSTSAALGLATWQVTMTGSTEIQATGQIRVLQRQSTL
jgi:hypothetical protein